MATEVQREYTRYFTMNWETLHFSHSFDSTTKTILGQPKYFILFVFSIQPSPEHYQLRMQSTPTEGASNSCIAYLISIFALHLFFTENNLPSEILHFTSLICVALPFSWCERTLSLNFEEMWGCFYQLLSQLLVTKPISTKFHDLFSKCRSVVRPQPATVESDSTPPDSCRQWNSKARPASATQPRHDLVLTQLYSQSQLCQKKRCVTPRPVGVRDEYGMCTFMLLRSGQWWNCCSVVRNPNLTCLLSCFQQLFFSHSVF